jgi:hypothetical protein
VNLTALSKSPRGIAFTQFLRSALRRVPEAGVGVVHVALGPRNDATLIVCRWAVLLDRAVYSPVDRSREVGGAGSMARYRLTQSDEPALNGLDCATLPLASHWPCLAGASGVQTSGIWHGLPPNRMTHALRALPAGVAR